MVRKCIEEGKASKKQAPTIKHKKLGLMRLCRYTKQSYIQYQSEGKWVLYVAVSEKQAANHAVVAEKLLKIGLAGSLSKEQIVKERAELLAN